MHDRRGRPNQDAVASARANEDPLVVVAAVSDGHGGDRYVRSAVGARLAVDTACSIAVERIAAGTSITSLLKELPKAIVSRWRELIAEELASNPFTLQERKRAGVDLDDEPEL